MDSIVKKVKNNVLIIALIIMIIGIIIIDPSFFQVRVFKDILVQSSVKMIVALGLMLVLLIGGTDLSGGRQVGLSAVIVASLMQSSTYIGKFFPNLPDLPIIIPVLVVLIVMAVIGIVNGILITKFKMAPFIATFAMSTIVFGLNSLYYAMEPNRSQPIGGIRTDFTSISNYKIFGFLSPLIPISIALIVLIWILLNKTTLGKNIYATGGNKSAAHVSGIKVNHIIIIVFIIESLLLGVAGILEVARSGGANSAYGLGYEFDAISACVVGGVSLKGGIGKVSGTVIGVLIFTIITYGLAYIGVNPNWQQIIKGLIIIVAIALDSKKTKEI